MENALIILQENKSNISTHTQLSNDLYDFSTYTKDQRNPFSHTANEDLDQKTPKKSSVEVP